MLTVFQDSRSFKPSEISDKFVPAAWFSKAGAYLLIRLHIMRPFTGILLIGDVVTLSVEEADVRVQSMLCSHIEATLAQTCQLSQW